MVIMRGITVRNPGKSPMDLNILDKNCQKGAISAVSQESQVYQ